MDRELWTIVLASVKRAARVVGRQSPWRRRPRFADWLVVAMYVWSVRHDRPLCWACDRSHYGSLFRPGKLPSVSQFTRRVKDERFQLILQRVHDELAQRGTTLCDFGYIDGKPLPVSPVSKDRTATRGKVCGGYAKGYKLHAFVNDRRRIVVWSVVGLNVAEQSVAAEMIELLPPLLAPGRALVMADANYDSAPLHKRSDPLGVCLLHPLKGQQRVGERGHHAVTLRQMGAARRGLVRAWDERPDLLRYLLALRDEVERAFGVLCCTAGGLAALPAWVRTLGRVRRWVGVKVILYNARLAVQDRLRNLSETDENLVAA